MSEIRVKENESLESALRRFKRSCAKEGVIAEVKKREHYVSPSLSVSRSLKLPVRTRESSTNIPLDFCSRPLRFSGAVFALFRMKITQLLPEPHSLCDPKCLCCFQKGAEVVLGTVQGEPDGILRK